MIYRRQPQGNFYIRRELGGKDITKMLDTADRGTAVSRARAWLDELVTAAATDKWSTLDALRTRTPWPTIGEILARYTERAPGAGQIAERTAAANASSLRSLLRDATASADPDALRADILTESTVRTFVEKSRAAGRSESGIRSTLIQSRSVFARSLAYIYDGLRLPDLGGWRTPIRFSADRSGFEPIPDAVLQEMERGAAALRTASPAAWSVYQLMSRLGLRNSEVERAQTSHIRPGADRRYYLHIEGERTGDTAGTKNGRSRQLYLPDGLRAELLDIAGEGTHLIPAESRTERFDITHREINRFVRQYLPERVKKSYELRKWAGSVIWTRYGREACAAFLGDRTDTVETYYAAWLSPVESVTHADHAAIYAPAKSQQS